MLLLKRLGIKADIYHCNEGHAALLNLQRLADYINEEGLGFNEAPVDPDTPDEGETYLKVVLNVKPWIVRDLTNIVL